MKHTTAENDECSKHCAACNAERAMARILNDLKCPAATQASIIEAVLELIPDDATTDVVNDWVGRVSNFTWGFSHADTLDRYWFWGSGTEIYSRKDAEDIAADYSRYEEKPYVVGLIERNVHPKCEFVDVDDILERIEDDPCNWLNGATEWVTEDDSMFDCSREAVLELHVAMNAVFNEWLSKQSTNIWRCWREYPVNAIAAESIEVQQA